MVGQYPAAMTQLPPSGRSTLLTPKLPVVQVTPFLRERENTWYKDKSLPEFYEKPALAQTNTESLIRPANQTQGPSSTEGGKESAVSLAHGVDKALEPRPPQRGSAGALKSRMVNLSQPMDNRGRRVVHNMLSPRVECISPDSAIKVLPKRGFAPTIVDREKKTQEDSQQNKSESLLNKSQSRQLLSRQQTINLKGMKLADGSYPGYNFSQNRVPVRSLEEFYRQLMTTYKRSMPSNHLRSHFMTLSNAVIVESRSRKTRKDPPLISVNNESIDQRLHSSLDSTDSKSAFRLLNTAGKPTSIEQHLARDYKSFLDDNRSGAQSSASHHMARILRLKSSNPTQGELFIEVSREYNRRSNWIPKKMPQKSSSLPDNHSRSWCMLTDEHDFPFSPDAANVPVANVELTAHKEDDHIAVENSDISVKLPDINNNMSDKT